MMAYVHLMSVSLDTRQHYLFEHWLLLPFSWLVTSKSNPSPLGEIKTLSLGGGEVGVQIASSDIPYPWGKEVVGWAEGWELLYERFV